MTLTWQIALVALGALIVVYAWLQAIERRGRAIGKIIKIESDDETSAPVISFSVDGLRYEFRPTLVLRSEGKKSAIGKEVRVAYNPRNPHDAEIATPMRRYLPAIIATIAYASFVYWHYWAK